MSQEHQQYMGRQIEQGRMQLPFVDILPSHEMLQFIHGNFIAELEDAHTAYIKGNENPTSIPFIAERYPSIEPLVEDGEPFEVLIIGGTDISRAFCTRNGSTVEILEKQDSVLAPPLRRKDEFLSYVASTIDPGVRVVAINLAMKIKPAFIRGRYDAELIGVQSDRPISPEDMIGRTIGAELEDYLVVERGRHVTVSVGSESISHLLFARTQTPGDNVGLITVGTGVGAGLLLDKDTIVCLETAEFDKFPQSDLAIVLARESGSPFGKETNGGNLFRHFNAKIQELAIDFPSVGSTRELSELAQAGIPGISDLAQMYITRSAMLIACQVAGMADFKGTNMIFLRQGSVIVKAPGYKEMVEQTVKQLTDKDVQFVEIPDSGILGTAKLIA